ncbi:electron transfer flavoprotein subunit alpha/FixB family protein [soil metagenome]
MSKILAYVSHSGGAPSRASLEILSKCREMAGQNGWEVEAVLLAADSANAAEVGRGCGVAMVRALTNPIFSQHLNAPVVDALANVIREVQPDLVVFPSNESVKDVLGALAARLDAPALPDVSTFEVGDGVVTAVRPVMAAKFLSHVEAGGKPVLVSVRSGSYEATDSDVHPEVDTTEFTFEESDLAQTLREVASAATGAVDLNEARVVVAAGRGVRDEEGKRLVEELAEVTGGAIGASRAVVESGMFPATAQIGQTGKVVSPEVYFAVGLSGAIQHTAGMSNSRIIVAINKDPDATIFQTATYGLVGDLYQILPALIAEIRDRKS